MDENGILMLKRWKKFCFYEWKILICTAWFFLLMNHRVPPFSFHDLYSWRFPKFFFLRIVSKCIVCTSNVSLKETGGKDGAVGGKGTSHKATKKCSIIDSIIDSSNGKIYAVVKLSTLFFFFRNVLIVYLDRKRIP